MQTTALLPERLRALLAAPGLGSEPLLPAEPDNLSFVRELCSVLGRRKTVVISVRGQTSPHHVRVCGFLQS